MRRTFINKRVFKFRNNKKILIKIQQIIYNLKLNKKHIKLKTFNFNSHNKKSKKN